MKLSLARAYERSAAFRALFPPLSCFPLWSIVRTTKGAVCACPIGAKCGRCGKHPRCQWGQLGIAEKWRSDDPEAGYGIATGDRSDVFVLDLDGRAAIDAALEAGTIPETFTVARDDEHLHLYFKMPPFAVRNSRGSFAPGIDIRGDGGFVVGPGSPHRTGRTYEIVVDAMPAPAPEWLLTWDGLRRADEAPAAAPVPVVAGSAEEAARIAEAIEYLASAPAAISGRDGHGTLWIVAQTLVRSIELPIETAYALILTHYNDRCSPPWSEREIRHKLRQAQTRGRFPLRSEVDAFNAMLLGSVNRPTP